MRRFLLVYSLFAMLYSCHAQNGPTQPNVILTWTQSTSSGVTANCVYRCTGASCTPAPPALFCSTAPIVTYTDSTVAASSTDVYAVTAKVGATESAYSGTASVAVPANPNAPTGLAAPTVTENRMLGTGLDLHARVDWNRADSPRSHRDTEKN
jgi:hypothetical protein